ncbi:hypothetical protein SLEP1_g7712 [Rubroshorea leprosula]|uniref:peroxidase n=1 Tax=Rubroshorea leprosula TaxID=152421 RepID=A0AAV5I525_9ROSI|nr:hypothetical protein SLEP1_g7712 [Rubroshorea leprosula]
MPQHVQHCTRGSQAGSGAQQNDARIGAKILLLHFYDCFVKGCDGSILLDNDSANGVTSEKYACPNANSVMGFDVFDHIKTALGNECPSVVSCADIFAIVSQFLEHTPLVGLNASSFPQALQFQQRWKSRPIPGHSTPGKTSGCLSSSWYLNNQGLLQTDQDLFSASGADTVAIVDRFANSQSDFFDSFGQSMIKMGNISP